MLDELPEKTELIVPVELSEEELAIYENIRTRTLSGLQSEKINPIEALMALTKLRQAACSPELVDKHLTIPSSKIPCVSGAGSRAERKQASCFGV